eukprot:g21200.t1
MPNLELVVPLRQSLRQAEPRPHIALCTQQVWDFEGLEQRVPKHAEFWFRYYSDYLGVDKIYLYDLDGSFRELSIVKELQERGKLFYEGSIPSIPPLRDLYQKAGYKTSTTHLAQTLVQQHCWQRARQNADWVISVSHACKELDPRELTYVLGVRYGIKQDAPKAAEANVFTRFPYHIDPSVRPEQLLSTEEQIVIANPRLVFEGEKKLCSGRSRELRHSHNDVKAEVEKSEADLAQAEIEIETMNTKIEVGIDEAGKEVLLLCLELLGRSWRLRLHQVKLTSRRPKASEIKRLSSS